MYQTVNVSNSECIKQLFQFVSYWIGTCVSSEWLWSTRSLQVKLTNSLSSLGCWKREFCEEEVLSLFLSLSHSSGLECLDTVTFGWLLFKLGRVREKEWKRNSKRQRERKKEMSDNSFPSVLVYDYLTALIWGRKERNIFFLPFFLPLFLDIFLATFLAIFLAIFLSFSHTIQLKNQVVREKQFVVSSQELTEHCSKVYLSFSLFFSFSSLFVFLFLSFSSLFFNPIPSIFHQIVHLFHPFILFLFIKSLEECKIFFLF